MKATVKLFKANTITRNRCLFPKKQINKFPKELPVYKNFDASTSVGTASNFRWDKDYILCDIDINKNIKNIHTLAPTFLAKDYECKTDGKEKYGVVNDVQLIEVSITDSHSIKELEHNIKKDKNNIKGVKK